jgi:hypothetical protein
LFRPFRALKLEPGLLSQGVALGYDIAAFQAAALPSSLKGSNIPAQGNALGIRRIINYKP